VINEESEGIDSSDNMRKEDDEDEGEHTISDYILENKMLKM
jgi:hypothetical protein